MIVAVHVAVAVARAVGMFVLMLVGVRRIVIVVVALAVFVGMVVVVRMAVGRSVDMGMFMLVIVPMMVIVGMVVGMAVPRAIFMYVVVVVAVGLLPVHDRFLSGLEICDLHIPLFPTSAGPAHQAASSSSMDLMFSSSPLRRCRLWLPQGQGV